MYYYSPFVQRDETTEFLAPAEMWLEPIESVCYYFVAVFVSCEAHCEDMHYFERESHLTMSQRKFFFEINDHESDNALEESFSSVQGGNISNLINNQEESKIEINEPRYPVRGNRTEPASYRDMINKPRQTISPAKQKKIEKRKKKSSEINHLDGSMNQDESQNDVHMETE